MKNYITKYSTMVFILLVLLVVANTLLIIYVVHAAVITKKTDTISAMPLENNLDHFGYPSFKELLDMDCLSNNDLVGASYSICQTDAVAKGEEVVDRLNATFASDMEVIINELKTNPVLYAENNDSFYGEELVVERLSSYTEASKVYRESFCGMESTISWGGSAPAYAECMIFELERYTKTMYKFRDDWILARFRGYMSEPKYKNISESYQKLLDKEKNHIWISTLN